MAAEQSEKRGAARVQNYKVEAKDGLKALIQSAGDIIFTDFRGLTVGQITELRRSLREQKSTFRVVKNSFASRAFAELGVSGAEPYFFGPTALAVAERDASPVARVLVEFARNSTLGLKGGYVGRKLVTAEQVEAISRLPTRNEMIAILMATIRAPVSSCVYVLNGVVQKLLRTLVAVGEKKANEAA